MKTRLFFRKLIDKSSRLVEFKSGNNPRPKMDVLPWRSIMFDIKEALKIWDTIQEIDIDEENHGIDYTPEESQKADKRVRRLINGLGDVIRDGFDLESLRKHANK